MPIMLKKITAALIFFLYILLIYTKYCKKIEMSSLNVSTDYIVSVQSDKGF